MNTTTKAVTEQLADALLAIRDLQSFASTDGRGMQGDNATELESIIDDALARAGVTP